MRNPKKKYDVIVVGAGAAGCLFSRNIAREGYSVCLVEKSNRNELSYDWWDGVDKTIFDDVGIANPKGEELYKNGEVIICSPLNSLQIKLPPEDYLYYIDRRKFTIRLLNEAIKTGVAFFDKKTVIGPILDERSETIIGIRIHNLDPIYAKLIVDCSDTGV